MRVPVKLLGFVFWLFSLNCQDGGVTASGNAEEGNADVIHFECVSIDKKIHGSSDIHCTETGESSDTVPKCKEITCRAPDIPNGYVVERVEEYQKDAVLKYRCSPGFKPREGIPRCAKFGWTLNPECDEATCPLNTTEEDLTIEGFPDIEGPVKPGHKLIFSCNGRGMKVKGQSEIICQSNGEWSSPFPKCEEVTCVANLPVNMRSDRSDPGHEVSVRPGQTLTLSCVRRGLKLQGQSTITCGLNGEWDVQLPKCGEGKCGRPPSVNFADTKEITKPEYNSGQRVEYICVSKYTLDQRPPYSKYLTCDQGEWRGDIKCLKPCTVTLEEMDKRGIQLRWTEKQRMFAPHDDYISFDCQSGKRLKVNNLRQKCNDGVMTLPECE